MYCIAVHSKSNIGLLGSDTISRKISGEIRFLRIILVIAYKSLLVVRISCRIASSFINEMSVDNTLDNWFWK